MLLFQELIFFAEIEKELRGGGIRVLEEEREGGRRPEDVTGDQNMDRWSS